MFSTLDVTPIHTALAHYAGELGILMTGHDGTRITALISRKGRTDSEIDQMIRQYKITWMLSYALIGVVIPVSLRYKVVSDDYYDSYIDDIMHKMRS